MCAIDYRFSSSIGVFLPQAYCTYVLLVYILQLHQFKKVSSVSASFEIEPQLQLQKQLEIKQQKEQQLVWAEIEEAKHSHGQHHSEANSRQQHSSGI